MNLEKKLESIKPYELNCNIFDVYSYNGLTMQELLCQFFSKINECVNVSNETIDLAKWLVEVGLEQEVVKKVMSLLHGGTFENIINVNLLGDINNEIQIIKDDLLLKPNTGEVIKKGEVGLNDCTTELLGAINGNTTVDVLSIPRDKSVNATKTTFLENMNKNLFDGNFIGGYITDTEGDGSFRYTTTQDSKIIAIDIKPDTTYSINKESLPLDDGYYWFKLISFRKPVKEILNNMSQGWSQYVDGSVCLIDTNTTKDRTNYTFTTNSLDKSIFVCVAKTLNPYVEIIEGVHEKPMYPNYIEDNRLRNIKLTGEELMDNSIKPLKTSFIGNGNKNMFNGKFINGYITGSVGNGYYTNTQNGMCLAFDVKPNTTYSINKKAIGLDNGYYWFKVISFTKTKNEVLEIVDKSTTLQYDGSIGIFHADPNIDKTNAIFTTGQNDKSIFVCVARSLTPYVEVLEGSYNKIKYNTYNPFDLMENVKIEEKNIIKNETNSKNIFIKNGNKLNITINEKVKYTLEKKVLSDVKLDTWLLTFGGVNNTTLWEGTDIEGPIKEVGAADFVGGVHGDEIIESVTMLKDGEILDLNNNYNETSFNNLTVFVKSTLNRCNTTTPLFTRYKKLEFTEEGLKISNRLVCLTESKIERYTGCGLYSVYKENLVGYSTNTVNTLLTSGGVKENVNLDEGYFYGEGFTINIKTLSGKTNNYKGFIQDFYNEVRPRYKLYLDSINNPSGYNINPGQELNASFIISIY